MPRNARTEARRRIPALAAFGAALLAGCGGDPRPARPYYGGGNYYGGPSAYAGSPYSYGYGGLPSYAGSPFYGPRPYGGFDRFGGPRGYYGGGNVGRPPAPAGPPPRTETWSQDRLRQHWIEQAQRAR